MPAFGSGVAISEDWAAVVGRTTRSAVCIYSRDGEDGWRYRFSLTTDDASAGILAGSVDLQGDQLAILTRKKLADYEAEVGLLLFDLNEEGYSEKASHQFRTNDSHGYYAPSLCFAEDNSILVALTTESSTGASQGGAVVVMLEQDGRFAEHQRLTSTLHLDEEFCKDTMYGQRIVNSLFTLGLVIGVTVGETTLGTTLGNADASCFGAR